MTVLVFYHYLTDNGAAGFYEAPDDMIVRLLKDWMKAHPHGYVKVMTQEQFRHTVWYRAFLEKGWGPMTYTPENNDGNPPGSQPSNQHGASVPEPSVGH